MRSVKDFNKFSSALKYMRTERGISVQEMSEIIGISTSFLYEIESGKKRCPWNRIDNLFSALNLNGDEKLYFVSLLVKENKDVSNDIVEILGYDMVARLITLKYCKGNMEDKKSEKDSVVFNFESRMNEMIK